ncbi:hypothetical protein BaRGS_00001631 [Batillaria attramentaria]|uniref:Uncharacterized protein n=1 Tax=Batillaria attramentaria TaxID=370345 RepID=A0ABD0M8H7_9CAEN
MQMPDYATAVYSRRTRQRHPGGGINAMLHSVQASTDRAPIGSHLLHFVASTCKDRSLDIRQNQSPPADY